jgi:hypothetical protein
VHGRPSRSRPAKVRDVLLLAHFAAYAFAKLYLKLGPYLIRLGIVASGRAAAVAAPTRGLQLPP